MIRKIVPTEPDQKSESKGAPWTNLVREDFHVAVYKDAYPVTENHTLFVPQYNNLDVLMDAMEDAVRQGLNMVNAGLCDGFNVGINVGQAAGQTCGWPHVHLIPRRNGDMPDPTGGVRHVIPEKGNYKKT